MSEYKPAAADARVVTIIAVATLKGLGEDSNDPVRTVYSLFTQDGRRLAELDSMTIDDEEARALASLISAWADR